MQHPDPVVVTVGWSDRLASANAPPLASDENVLTLFPVDLDVTLRFSHSLIALTDARLLSGVEGGTWSEWPLGPGMRLNVSDHAGLGALELCDTRGRLAVWRFTLTVMPQVIALQTRFEFLVSGPEQAEEVLADIEDKMAPSDAVPSTWVLLRLWRFAHPYRWQLLGGLLLTLGSTAATLVPPYLTIPLMDEILIPFQNGQEIPAH